MVAIAPIDAIVKMTYSPVEKFGNDRANDNANTMYTMPANNMPNVRTDVLFEYRP